MTIENFKENYLHHSLLVAFEDMGKTDALTLYLNDAIAEYTSYVNYLTSVGVTPSFNQDIFIVKVALTKVYSWILQDAAFLTSIKIDDYEWDDSDKFKHFMELLKAEQKDIEDIKANSRKDIDTFLKNGSYGGAFLNIRMHRRGTWQR